MNRYGCFSITGWLYPAEGGKTNRALPVRWYVYDTTACGEIVAVYKDEHEARLDVFRSNADERRWEKEQEGAFDWMPEPQWFVEDNGR